MRFEAKGVCYAYPGGGQAVRDVHFAVDPGERVALAGRNGAGKSTLARLCCGLAPPCAGSVLLDGREACSLPPKIRARLAGYVFQDPASQLFAATTREELAYGPRNVGFSGEALTAAVENAAAMAGLSGLMEANPFELSLSTRRMVALASTLAMGPGLLFLDEPTAGLDLPARRLLEGILARLGREGVAVIVISHDMDFCAANLDRILVMAGGALAADEPAARFFTNEERAKELGLVQPEAARLGRLTGLAQAPRDADDFLRLFAAARAEG